MPRTCPTRPGTSASEISRGIVPHSFRFADRTLQGFPGLDSACVQCTCPVLQAEGDRARGRRSVPWLIGRKAPPFAAGQKEGDRVRGAVEDRGEPGGAVRIAVDG